MREDEFPPLSFTLHLSTDGQEAGSGARWVEEGGGRRSQDLDQSRLMNHSIRPPRPAEMPRDCRAPLLAASVTHT